MKKLFGLSCLALAVASPANVGTNSEPNAYFSPWTCRLAKTSTAGSTTNATGDYIDTTLTSGDLLSVPPLPGGTVSDHGFVSWVLNVNGFQVGVLPNSSVKVFAGATSPPVHSIVAQAAGTTMVFTSVPDLPSPPPPSPNEPQTHTPSIARKFVFNLMGQDYVRATARHEPLRIEAVRKIKVKISGSSAVADGTVFSAKWAASGKTEIVVLEGTIRVCYVNNAGNEVGSPMLIHSGYKLDVDYYDGSSGTVPRIRNPSPII